MPLAPVACPRMHVWTEQQRSYTSAARFPLHDTCVARYPWVTHSSPAQQAPTCGARLEREHQHAGGWLDEARVEQVGGHVAQLVDQLLHVGDEHLEEGGVGMGVGWG